MLKIRAKGHIVTAFGTARRQRSIVSVELGIRKSFALVFGKCLKAGRSYLWTINDMIL